MRNLLVLFAFFGLLAPQAAPAADELYLSYECYQGEAHVARILLDVDGNYYVQVGRRNPAVFVQDEDGAFRAGPYELSRKFGTDTAVLRGNGLTAACYAPRRFPLPDWPF